MCSNPTPSIHTLSAPVIQDVIAEPPRTSRIPDWPLQMSAHQLPVKAQTQSDAEKHMDTALIDILSGDDVNGPLFRHQEERDWRSRVCKSGTLPFVARHILEGNDVRHYPVQDLESTIYLIFWVAVYIVKRRTNNERLHDNILICITKLIRPDSRNDLRVCAIYKRSLLMEWANQSLDEAKTEYFGAFAPFAEILCGLGKLGKKWYRKSLGHGDNSTMFTPDEIEQAFEEYLHVYDKYIPTEESWDYLQRLEF